MSLQSKSETGPVVTDVSVAILYPGNRVDKMAVPLKASQMDVAIEPYDAYSRDIVVVDNADRHLFREVVKNRCYNSTLVYRMRGDVFHELSLWNMNPAKKWAARNCVLPNVDGVIAVTERLAEKYTAVTGVQPTASAGLWKRVAEWPTVSHSDDELRIVTLTNPNYWQKVTPLAIWAETVEAVLAETGGHWHICGDGTHADRLDSALDGYEHVSFVGYVDAKAKIANSNLMIHASNLDGSPNAILEGLASQLPVITNDWVEFEQHGGPLDVMHSQAELRQTLSKFANPHRRQRVGETAKKYMEVNHTPEAIAQDYERYVMELLTHD